MELKFTFTKEEAQLIVDALVKQPYEKVFLVVNKLQEQAIKQMEPEKKK